MTNTLQQALARARAESRHPVRSWKGMCQMFVRTCWGVGGGYGSAYQQWLHLPAHARHRGGKPSDAPVGAALFYKGRGKFGHIMMACEPFADGTPAAYSNDLVRSGKIDKVRRTDPTTKWGEKYLGYGTSINGHDIPVAGKAHATPLAEHTAAVKPKPAPVPASAAQALFADVQRALAEHAPTILAHRITHRVDYVNDLRHVQATHRKETL